MQALEHFFDSEVAKDSALSALNLVVYAKDSVAFRNADDTISYGELSEGALRFASLLLARLDQLDDPSDEGALADAPHIALGLGPGSVFCKLLMGSLASSLIVTCIDENDPVEDQLKILEAYNPHFVVLDADRKSDGLEQLATGRCRTRFLWVDSENGFDALVEGIAPAVALPRYEPERPALIIHTSGSSGESKGVVLTHGNIARSAPGYEAVCDLESEDQLVYLGSFHNSTLVVFLATLRAGACFHYLGPKVTRFPRLVAQYFEEHMITKFSGPASYFSLLERSGGLNPIQHSALSTLELWGEAIYANVISGFMRLLPNIRVFASYDCSEALCATFVCYNSANEVEGVDTVVYQPSEGVKVEIASDSAEQGPTDRGQPKITGHNVMLGYWHEIRSCALESLPSSPRTVILNDEIELSEEGAIRVLGRVDDVVKIQGLRVSLKEVEEVLLANANVVSAVALEVRNRFDVAVIHAVVCVQGCQEELKSLERELLRQCAQHLSREAIPRQIFFASDLPQTSSGKIDRREVSVLLASGQLLSPAQNAEPTS